MADWLLELFSEEIPARMQAGAARDLERMVKDQLIQRGGIPSNDPITFCGPRRLTMMVDGLSAVQPGRADFRTGPKTSAPRAAIDGFAARAGLDADQLTVENGQFIARIEIPERRTADDIAQIVPHLIRHFPWPKSMTWGSGSLRWVRPLHRILCVFDGEVVPFEVDGIVSGDQSEGHRVMAAGRVFRARGFAEYRQSLSEAFVVLDAGERAERIAADANAIAEARGLCLVEDAGLLAEVAGMVEWPVVLLGDMDERFLQLPPEVIRTTMRTHQRYFAVRAPDGELAPHFVAVANLQTPDGGALIAKGNGRVLAARLADARFFWDEDRKVRLEDRLSALEGAVFHAKLGTMRERADRLERLAAAIAPLVGAEAARARCAGRLAKADLVSGMVGEFPELQGLMGGYYARAEGLGDDIADAIADHYRPQGPGDAAPTAPIAIAVALADKLDTIVGFFSIGETPTGSRDPFALRRAALGILRILAESALPIGYRKLIDLAASVTGRSGDGVAAFFAERLRVSLRDRGARPDILEAIFAIGDDVPARVTARLDALDAFLGTRDGANLLAGCKRAINILAAEAKKGPLPTTEACRPSGPPAEVALYDALESLDPRLDADLAAEDFAAAMTALASLRAPVDRFFEDVMVNSDDPAERDNRLALLMRVRSSMARVADFALIQG
jgi:glycyl-tRNA synthetase beta chain